MAGGFFDQIIADHEHIHIGSQETIDRLSWLQDDGLVIVERGIEQNWYAGEFFKVLN